MVKEAYSPQKNEFYFDKLCNNMHDRSNIYKWYTLAQVKR